MRMMKFLLAGNMGLATYYALLYGLTEHAGVWYLASAIVASIVATAINFNLHKFWTFQNPDKSAIGMHATKYGILTAIFMAANAIALYFAVEYLRMPYMFMQLCITAFLFPISYIATREILEA